MQLTEVAQQPILRIDARTKFALLFGVGISSLMFPPYWLEATTFALMALLLALNSKFYCRIPYYAPVGLDTIVKGQWWLCSAVFYPCQVWAAHASDFYGRYSTDENHFCQRVYAFLRADASSQQTDYTIIGYVSFHPNNFRGVAQYPGCHAFPGDWHFCAFCADKANDDTGIYDGAAADVNRYDC